MKKTVKYWFGPLFHLFFPRCCAVCGASLIEGEDTICTRCNIDMPRTNYHKMKDNPVERMFWGKFPQDPTSIEVWWKERTGSGDGTLHGGGITADRLF